jgi:hypothetical protein
MIRFALQKLHRETVSQSRLSDANTHLGLSQASVQMPYQSESCLLMRLTDRDGVAMRKMKAEGNSQSRYECRRRNHWRWELVRRLIRGGRTMALMVNGVTDSRRQKMTIMLWLLTRADLAIIPPKRDLRDDLCHFKMSLRSWHIWLRVRS